jgi:hypothetical protein
VAGLDAGDLTLATTGTLSGIAVTTISPSTGLNSVYTVTLNTGSGDGTVRLDVPAGNGFADAAGNRLTAGFTSGPAFTIDRTPPTPVGITGDAYTNGGTIDFLVRLSDPPAVLNGVDLSDFQMVAGGPVGASITAIAPDGPAYRVTVNTGSGDGTLQLRLLDDDSNRPGRQPAGRPRGRQRLGPERRGRDGR